MACASWCRWDRKNCVKDMCTSCAECTPSPSPPAQPPLVAIPVGHVPSLVEEEDDHEPPDLSAWPCAAWCRYSEKACGRDICRGCPECDDRPRHCLTWGTLRTNLGHVLHRFCSTDVDAYEWCEELTEPTESDAQPGTFSMWILSDFHCCDHGTLRGDVEGCPAFDPKPPSPPQPPPPPPSPCPPPPPFPLPPAPRPPPPPPMKSNLDASLPHCPPLPPVIPPLPLLPPSPPSHPASPFYPLIGGALPPSAPEMASVGVGRVTLFEGVALLALLPAIRLAIRLRSKWYRAYVWRCIRSRGKIRPRGRGDGASTVSCASSARHMPLTTFDDDEQREARRPLTAPDDDGNTELGVDCGVQGQLETTPLTAHSDADEGEGERTPPFDVHEQADGDAALLTASSDADRLSGEHAAVGLPSVRNYEQDVARCAPLSVPTEQGVSTSGETDEISWMI